MLRKCLIPEDQIVKCMILNKINPIDRELLIAMGICKKGGPNPAGSIRPLDLSHFGTGGGGGGGGCASEPLSAAGRQ